MTTKLLSKAIIVMFGNHKGGVGKTTLVINTGDAFVREGYRVLMIDLDPQGNLSEHCAAEGLHTGMTFADIVRKDLDEVVTLKKEAIQPCIVEGACLIKSAKKSVDLEEIKRDLESADFILPEQHIRDVIFELAKGFDIVLIDTPPNLGTLTTSAMISADHLIIPIEAESMYALYGTDDLINKMEVVKRRLNPNLNYLGVVINKLRRTQSAARVLEDSIRATQKTFESTIRTTKDIVESQMKKKTVLASARSSRVAQDIVDFAREALLAMGLKVKGKIQKTKQVEEATDE